MITVPTVSIYSQVVFAEAVSAHAESVSSHATVDDAASSAHAAETGSTHDTTFSGADADNISNYHATYPVWVYASHPSQDCEIHNQNCPPTDPNQLAKFNKMHDVPAWIWWVLGGIVVVVLIAATAL